MKKLALFLATQKGFAVLQRLCESEYMKHIGCVVSFHEIGVKKDWCGDLENVCKRYSIPFYLWNDVKGDLTGLIRQVCATSVMVISWRFLLPLRLNEFLEDKIIVFHDSLLPKYRGFAPVVTALLCNESIVGATALFASDSVDAGDIILQRSMTVSPDEYICDVIERMADLYVSMAIEITAKLIKGELFAIPQNEKDATYSIWRDEKDYEIDWTADAVSIYNKIRATGYPYKGACARIGDETIRIVSARIENDITFAVRDCGKIWNLNGGNPIVVCGKGMLCITKATYENGTPYDFLKLRMRFSIW